MFISIEEKDKSIKKTEEQSFISMFSYVVEELGEQLAEGLECFDHGCSVECHIYELNKSYIVKE